MFPRWVLTAGVILLYSRGNIQKVYFVTEKVVTFCINTKNITGYG